MADGSIGDDNKDNFCVNDESKREKYLGFVLGQIDYHNTLSKNCKNLYRMLFYIQAVISFGITLIGIFIAKGVPDDSYLTYVVGIAGVLLSAITTLHSAGQFNSRWLHHRNICQTLESELRVYEVDSGEYQKIDDVNDKFHAFVKKIENIISKEHQTWKVITKEGKKHEPAK